jgi:hypothetical protein
MFRKLKTQWRELRAAPPGRRFRQRYERRAAERKTPAARIVWSALAVILILAGIVALPLPGPGTLVIAAGLALLAQESLTVARFCDRVELAIRKRVAA